jgi:hypothetical protein
MVLATLLIPQSLIGPNLHPQVRQTDLPKDYPGL